MLLLIALRLASHFQGPSPIRPARRQAELPVRIGEIPDARWPVMSHTIRDPPARLAMLLVVDDDPEFLEDAQRLAAASRGVFLARTADQAWDLIHCVGADFTMALVDVDLPGKDVFSLILELHKELPGLPIIAMSGGFQDHAVASANTLGAVEVVRKPITSAWSESIARIRAASTG